MFTFEDTGMGIRDEDKRILFNAFTRVGKDSRLRERTGLGLHLSRRLADALGGTITFESTLGKGSIFKLELPETGEFDARSDH